MIRRFGAFLLVATTAATLLSGCGDGAAASSATVAIHYSRFVPETITVSAGTPVTFTLRNDDPIGHEWIVGAPDVHARHRTGTEPVHDSVATEVTVPAFSERETTITFEQPGDYAYICHLPGHEAYGMVGMLRVVER